MSILSIMELFKINAQGLITNKAGVQVDKERVLQIIKAATKSLETAPARQMLPTQTSIPTEESKEFANFKMFISEEACMVSKMLLPFTENEYLKIKSSVVKGVPGFTWLEVRKTLREMHNWKPLLSKNTCACDTLINWIERKQEKLNGIYK